MNRIWGPLAALALLWPDRAAGPLDGIPLDRPAEAMLIGVVFPILWFVHPRFLTTRFARIGILALVLLRITSSAALTQQGWCVRFDPSQPYVAGQTGAPHAWDLRADWRAADPACSAIMTRSYGSLEAFPAWFFNLPPASESWPGPADRPPGATTRLTLRGFVTPRERGTLRIETTRDMSAVWSVDGGEAVAEAILDPGPHLIALDATLTGETWRLIPTWNGAAIWSQLTTVRRPRRSTGRSAARSARWRPRSLERCSSAG
jgi:hypothetical protein